MAKEDKETNASTITPEVKTEGTTAPTTEKAPKKTVEPGEEMIQVKKSEFEMVLKKIEDLSKNQKTLFDVADKSRLARIAERDAATLIRTVKISKWPLNDQYIVGWKLMKNMSEIVPGSGRWVEEQSTTLVFENGEVQEVPLIDFYRVPVKETADIVETNTGNKNGVMYTALTVEFPNGKQITIDSKFVN